MHDYIIHYSFIGNYNRYRWLRNGVHEEFGMIYKIAILHFTLSKIHIYLCVWTVNCPNLKLCNFVSVIPLNLWHNQQIEGNIFVLLNEVTPFILKHLSVTSRMDGMYQKDELEEPIIALRECCANALNVLFPALGHPITSTRFIDWPLMYCADSRYTGS